MLMQEYRVCQGDSAAELALEVLRNAREGFVPTGGFAVIAYPDGMATFYQPMARFVSPRES